MDEKQHSFVQRILKQLPPEERFNFTEQHVQSLHKAALSLPKTSHPINLRWSVPFFGKGFYVVLFAGKERRSRQRLMADKDYQLLPRAVVALSMVIGCSTIFGLMYGQRLFAETHERAASEIDDGPGFHPVVVPFKYTREECESSGRAWIDSQCVDHEHDPSF